MILSCPECSTRYALEAARLGEGRQVRCSVCHHQWWQETDPQVQAEEDLTPVEPIPDLLKPIPEGSAVPAINDDNADADGKKRSAFVTVILWLVLFSALTFAGAKAGQEKITEIWPPSAFLYEKFGMIHTEDKAGLVLENFLARKMTTAEGEKLLYFEAELANTDLESLPHPFLDLIIRDATGAVLKQTQWDRNVGILIKPGEKIPLKAGISLEGVAGTVKTFEITTAQPEHAEEKKHTEKTHKEKEAEAHNEHH